MSAADDWARALAEWAIPQEILDAAPADPWEFPVAYFARVADRPPDRTIPSYVRAHEALPEGGTILDIGCGAGAASLPHAARAGRLIGVDEGEGMLAAFAERAETAGVAHEEVRGRWPDVANLVETAEVVVCHHVLYNVADLMPFVAALTDHARSRVVVEMTAEHPRATENALWKELHGLDRPTRPTADDAIAVLSEAGVEVRAERWRKPLSHADLPFDQHVAMVRTDLCLPADRDGDIARALEKHPPPKEREVATLWWTPE